MFSNAISTWYSVNELAINSVHWEQVDDVLSKIVSLNFNVNQIEECHYCAGPLIARDHAKYVKLRKM